jgi:branched-chain amino acid transport system substrate-binding protein
MKHLRIKYLAVAGLLVLAASAQAEIKVGVILSTTGPAASLGIFEKNAVLLGPTEVGGQKIDYIFFDDNSDSTTAVKNARRLITDDNVDVIIGPTTTPAAMALISVVAEGKTPNITQGPVDALVLPVDNERRWMFKTTTSDEQEANPLFAQMHHSHVKKLAFIGFSDSYGDQWEKLARRYVASPDGPGRGIELVATERYARPDTSVTSQVLKMLSKNPDAILIAGSGGGAATPVLELRKRGYKKDIYVTLGATFGDFLKISGADAEGVYAPFAAVMGVNQVPNSYIAKKSVEHFVSLYDGKYGKGTSNIFAAGAWDATKLIEASAPKALEKAKPGTPEFRAALRDALENVHDYDGARGRYTMTKQDHAGLGSSALMLGQLRNGHWTLVQP